MHANNNKQQFNSKEMPRHSFNNGNPNPNEHHHVNGGGGAAEIPYFERQESDDYVALQDARRIIDVLHHRVRSLENINIDLEYRLEQQAKQTMQAEHEYTEIDRSWKVKFDELQKESEEWAKKYEAQTVTTKKLRDHLHRTERELYGMLQRKYELMRGGPGPQGVAAGAGGTVGGHEGHRKADGGGGGGSSTLSSTSSPRQLASNSTSVTPMPVEALCEVYRNLAPEHRERRFLMDMGDFFGT